MDKEQETAVHTPAEPKQTSSEKRSGIKDLLDYIEIFVFAICFVIVLFSFGFRLCTVSGPSMEKTLYHGEQLLVSDFGYSPKAGDIVVFHHLGEHLQEPVVKRVIATEGERVSIDYTARSMKVTVTDKDGNERVLEEPYMHYDLTQIPMRADMECTVGEGQLFVMGDNRNHSTDSRSAEIGLVDSRSVLGKVVFRLTPFNRFGSVQ